MTISFKHTAFCALLVACGSKSSLGDWPQVECGDQLCAEGELCVKPSPECIEVEVSCEDDTGDSETDAGPCYEWSYGSPPTQCQPPAMDCEHHRDVVTCLSEAHCDEGIPHEQSTFADGRLVCSEPYHEPYDCP